MLNIFQLSIPGKRRIIRVENALDEDEFDQFDDIPSLATLIKVMLRLKDETRYLHKDHNEKLKKVKKAKKSRTRQKRAN